MAALELTPAWQALHRHQPLNTTALALTAGDITADLSRATPSLQTWALLHALAAQENVVGARDALFASGIVNISENRAAEHWALRAEHLRADLAAVDTRLDQLVDNVRGGRWLGATGKPIDTIVNIGIGGSDLGPRLLVDALAHTTNGPNNGPRVLFIANIDPAAAARVLGQCNAETTLFIIASKSFTTLETMQNAQACRGWLQGVLGQNAPIEQHFVAVTSNLGAAAAFGIPSENCFDFPDTIGGRYSLWGPVGLAARLALGNAAWQQLLLGARTIDRHFATAVPEQNLPMALALLGIWHINFMNLTTHAVLPYAEGLARLPDYLQQLVMESNGKRVTADGAPVGYATAPVTFGAAGTTGQHSFYQLLHQGTQIVPSDIIITQYPAQGHDATAHRWLVANGLAQADALWHGRIDPDLPPHRQFPGQRPVTVLGVPALTPTTLGQLLALYEHKTFVQSVIWRINAFDQWGVELGKELAAQAYTRMQLAK